jgi:hypothetical protein
MHYGDPPFFQPHHAPLPRTAERSLPAPWEPYRPRRLPWRSLSQLAVAGIFLSATIIALT